VWEARAGQEALVVLNRTPFYALVAQKILLGKNVIVFQAYQGL
jgi:hypothetical protein